MKKTLTALGVVALMASFSGAAVAASSLVGTVAKTGEDSTATTLQVARSGQGNILFVPYFSTQNGNTTLLSLTNSSDVAKALKVRFRGATNSDDIFDFTLFLSPGDVWTASVSKGADGRSVLNTADNSMTLPEVNGRSFIVDRLPAYATDEQKAALTREGYIEILNMADVRENLTADGATAAIAANIITTGTKNPLWTALKHVNGTAPGINSLSAPLVAALQAPLADLDDAAALGFSAPTGGLSASWNIVNVAGASVAWSGEATALRATLANGTNAPGRIVFSPQMEGAVQTATLFPEVYSADPLFGSVGGTVTPAVVAQYFDFPDLSTPYVGTAAVAAGDAQVQAQAVSTALAVTNISNTFASTSQAAGAALNSSTDWTFSMPTRRYAVAMKYGATAANNAAVFNSAATTGNAASTFFTATNVSDTRKAEGLLTVQTGSSSPISTWDREEQTQTSSFVISPGTATTVTFPGEVSVLSFNNKSATATDVLGAEVAKLDVKTKFTEGWAQISTPGLAGVGLPIVGASFLKVEGPANAAGNSTNFGSTTRHNYTAATAALN